ncbi:unnamed protein product [Ophioblennius macclurei]
MSETSGSGPFPAVNRGPPSGRSSSRGSSRGRVTLKTVLGISSVSSSALTSDPNSGIVAYPAGCVVVLLHPKENQQSHIINTSRNPFTTVAFSYDGKHLVTGESGHRPCVRVWEVSGALVAEVQAHKYGVSCVAFSSNSSYIVSVGHQHDMNISVWDWKNGFIIASNKVSSRVLCVSFSEDNSYFVTAGKRHVKFWYLDASKDRRVNSTVPLIGRSGLLGDHKNCEFSGVACGRGLMVSNTYCVTTSGLLCVFSSKSREMEAWVNLKTSSSCCVCVSEDWIFCGCSDGVIRVFSSFNLTYISTLQLSHRLGENLSPHTPNSPGAHYPDSVALTFDPTADLLTCVYSDHSVYVWDIRDLNNVSRVYSAMYHSSSVWDVQVCPQLLDVSQACLPPSAFFTCSSDNTIRLWNIDAHKEHAHLDSNDLLKILHIGDQLQTDGKAAKTDGKVGIRVLRISPDGRHLAAGDRSGNLRIFDLGSLDELMMIEAHDSEVLCVDFSLSSCGVRLMATGSRDRLIHIFNVDKNFSLEKTLNDHSASITAIRFTGAGPGLTLVSCGADKSLYFQTTEQTLDGIRFSRSRQVKEKISLNDMDLLRMQVAVACQDRNVRVYNVETGKLKKVLKGSGRNEGALLKVQVDPSGSFFVTSCSDKSINIFDYESGDCVSTLWGHSEIVTCMRFTEDCRHLVTVSGDSCVFVWQLDPQMSSTMRRRRGLRSTTAPCEQQYIRRETFTVPCWLPRTAQEEELEEVVEEEPEEEAGGVRTPHRTESASDIPQQNDNLPRWLCKLVAEGRFSPFTPQSDLEPRQVRSRWAKPRNSPTICPTLSLNPTEEEEEEEEQHFHPQSLLRDLEEVQLTGPRHHSTFIIHPGSPDASTLSCQQSSESDGSTGSLEQSHDGDWSSLSQSSSLDNLEEDRTSLKKDCLTSSPSHEKFDTDPKTLQPLDQQHFLNHRLSISARFLSRFQDRLRRQVVAMPPHVMSSDEVGSVNVTPTNQDQTLVQSPASTTLTLNTSDCTSCLTDRPRPSQDAKSTSYKEEEEEQEDQMEVHQKNQEQQGFRLQVDQENLQVDNEHQSLLLQENQEAGKKHQALQLKVAQENQGSDKEHQDLLLQAAQIMDELKATAQRALHIFQQLGASSAGGSQWLRRTAAVFVLLHDLDQANSDPVDHGAPCGQPVDRGAPDGWLQEHSTPCGQLVDCGTPCGQH